MSCIFRPRLNSLWSMWYTLFFLFLNVYLVYLGFNRYQLYTEIKWPHGSYPNFWLTVYIGLYAACIPLMVLFFAFGLFKTGNLAGDNDRISERFERVIELTRSTRESCCARFWKSIWMHGPPLPQTVHIAFALCQMLAQQVMLSQLYRYGFINVGDFLNTELDFIFQRARQLATNLPMGDTRLQGFKITTEELAGSPLAPNILPVLMHARLFGIPLEFVNLVAALIFFACSYPSVFYRMSTMFSFMFSFQLIFLAADLVITYFGFCILFRIQETNYNSIRPIGLGQYLPGSLLPKIFFHPMVIFYLFIGSTVILIAGSVLVYSYGYQRYLSTVRRILNRRKIQQNEYTDLRHQQMDSHDNSGPSGYVQIIMAICYLIVLTVIKCPTIGGLVEIYDHEPRPILLTCIVFDAAYLLFWILFWICLVALPEWAMQPIHSVEGILNLQSIHKLGFSNVAGKVPSELKNALFMMCEDRMYVTDDPLSKQSLMRHALKTTAQDEVYLLRDNHSPVGKRVVIDDSQNTQMRMLEAQRQQTMANSMAAVNRSPVLTYQQGSMRGMSIPSQGVPDERFGTFHRPQHYAPGMLNHQVATLGRHSTTNLRHPEAYASISRTGKLVETNFDPQRGQIDYSTNSQYASYSRMPINRNPLPPQPILSNSGIYESRQASEPIAVQRGMNESNGSNSVKASPLVADKRDQSHYQRSALSSFNNGPRSSLSTAPKLLPVGPGLYNPNKPSVSASSSQQDNCFTPTSASINNGSSNASTTACSPNGPNFVRPNIPLYRYDHDTRGGSEPHTGNGTGNYGTLTKNSVSTGSAPRVAGGSGVVRMPIKSTTVSITQRHDDSANFSLSSSNDSDGHGRRMAANHVENDYATSVV